MSRGKTKKNKSKGLYIFDIETYPNLFTMVAEDHHTKEIHEFIIGNPQNDSKELLKFLDRDIWLVGYNNLAFDAQILEKMKKRRGNMPPSEIFNFAQSIIREQFPPYWPNQLSNNHLDLYKIWGYDNSARRSSLKWLEFTHRKKRIKDLPYPFDKEVTDKQIKNVVKYNRYDVEMTSYLFDMSEDKIALRKEIFKEYGDQSFLNLGDVNLGAKMFLKDLSKDMGISPRDLKKKKTKPKTMYGKDIILDYIEFENDEFQEVLDFYKDLVVTTEDDGYVNLKGTIDYKTEFEGIEYVYGAGGLHASMQKTLVKKKDGYLLLDVDVSSYYPNLAISNEWYPSHLSTSFCDIYKQMYDRRKSIPKSNLWNLALKLGLNAVFGKSNSKYSWLYDPEFTLKITINGQLLLTMLAEQLSKVSTLIQANTDGITVLVKEEDKHKIEEICEKWMKMTGLLLEEDEYEQMAIRDVNNYHAIFKDGSVKRKGAYTTYEDIQKTESYHKNPSGSAIPLLVDMCLTEGISPAEGIEKIDDIHEFMFGFKKKRNFEFLKLTPDQETGFVTVSRNSDRVLRYYPSIDGSSLYKQYLTGSLQGSVTTLLKGQTITTKQYVRSKKPELCEDLDKDYYIREAQKLIDTLEKYEY